MGNEITWNRLLNYEMSGVPLYLYIPMAVIVALALSSAVFAAVF